MEYQRRHLGGWGASPPQGERKKKNRKKEEKERKKEGNYEYKLQITTYKVLFFKFFNTLVALKNLKKFWPLKKKLK